MEPARPLCVLLLVLAAQAAEGSPSPASTAAAELWREVEVVRTRHGVPHIRAANLRAGGYALGWLQCEDYGPVAPERLWGVRGETALRTGRGGIESDFEALSKRARAINTYHLLEQETRDFYDGFAAGVNRYIEFHPAEFDSAMPRNFSGYDVAALQINDGPPAARIWRFLETMNGHPDSSSGPWLLDPEPKDPEGGSNAWALAPSRTKSRKAILLRNPPPFVERRIL